MERWGIRMNAKPSIAQCLRDDRRWLIVWATLLLALTSAPYVYAYAHAPAGGAFGGVLANPLDGQTYLAKMAQGAAGDWLFHLPFTSEPHEGAFLYTYYLFLGQVAGRLGIALPAMYHLARLANSLLFMAAAYACAVTIVPAQRRLAWLLLFLSSGLGWLCATLGYLSADLVVPEAIAFYSIYTNAHFPLALAAMLSLFLLLLAPFDAPPATRAGAWRTAGAALAAGIIALTQAFLFLVVALVIALFVLVRWRAAGRLPRVEVVRALPAALVAALLILPQWLALTGSPAMRAHAAQDVNLSPPLWDYLLSFGILIPLAIWGGWRALRRRTQGDLLLLIWAVANLALAYAPLALQRRLIMGAQVPLAFLAAAAVQEGLLRKAAPPTARRVTAALLAFAMLTNLFLLALGTGAAARQDPLLYLLPGEPAALAWLAAQPPAGVVVALPRTSIFIPGRTNQRVYYGHPMETLDAPRKKAEVEAMFAGQSNELLSRPDVGWLYIGPYERQQAAPAFLESLAGRPAAYESADVAIYRLPAGDSGQ